MKKFLSVFLTLAMMLTMLSLPLTSVSAEEPTIQSGEKYPIPSDIKDGGKFTAPDGVEYIVIKAKESFMNMKDANNYILGDDLDFTVDGTPTAWGTLDDWYGILEGNNHIVKGFSVNKGGMFGWTTTTPAANVSIRNITFGEFGASISVGGAADFAGLFAQAVGGTDGSSAKNISITNVTAYVKMPAATNRRYLGSLIGCVRKNSTATFTNCEVVGSMESTVATGFYIGGYIGDCDGSSTIKFTDCGFEGTVSAAGHSVGGYIGRCNSTGAIEFVRCRFEGSITAQQVAGGYIGKVNNSEKIEFEKCYTDATVAVTGSNKNRVGGYVGGNNSPISFLNCASDVAVTGAYGLGGYVGMNESGTVTVGFTNCLATGTVTASVTDATKNQFVAGFVGQKNAEATVSISTNCVNSVVVVAGVPTTTHDEPTVADADKLASGEYAYKLGTAFGQEIGVDKIPVLGGMPVIEREVGGVYYYGNPFECDEDEEGNMITTVRAQTTAVKNNTRDWRVLIAVSDEYLAAVESVKFTVTYTLKDGGAAVAELAGEQVSSFCVVKAAGKTYATEDGVVLLAVVITDVPTDAWTEMNVALEVTGSAEAEAAYNVSNVTFENTDLPNAN
ncbi:MAG: hypothetical protein IKC59_03095 [Clostridia bacterium]|nr:hypothetical protein [Clostridia bacterium]